MVRVRKKIVQKLQQMSTLNLLNSSSEEVVFGKGKDPVNDKSLKLTGMNFKRLLFVVRKNQQDKLPEN